MAQMGNIKDSLKITFFNAYGCDIFCDGIVEVTSFMMQDPDKSDIQSYASELLVSSSGTVPSNRNINFNTGYIIHLNSGLTVETNAIFSIDFGECDCICKF